MECRKNLVNGYCDKVCKRVPEVFCELACQGNWKEYRRKRIDPVINKVELTSEQKSNPDLVSVIICCDVDDAKYLKKTVESIKDNAVGKIEVIVMCDDWHRNDPPKYDYTLRTGIEWENEVNRFCMLNRDWVIQRVATDKKGLRNSLNFAVKNLAKGKYIAKLDAHCAMTPEWDVRIKASCVGDVVAAPCIDRLDELTWQGNDADMSFATINGNMRMDYIHPYSNIDAMPLECEAICITGCCFMMERDYYLRLGGCDESLGVWGALSTEWSLKTWLTGGKILLRTDVVCSHLFREKTPFTIDKFKLENAFRRLCEQWVMKINNPLKQTRDASWLVTHFSYINGYDIPMFGLGGGGQTIRPKDWEFLKAFIKNNDIKNVLEFGAGKSTLMFDQLGLKVTSVETIPHIRDTVKSLLSGNSEVVLSDFFTGWEQNDLIFIDGPAGGENREDNYKIVSESNTRFIACHDAHREWETKWIEKYFGGYKEIACMDDRRIRIFENASVRV
ncbi:MAG: hypothetical protein WC441_04910 [Patescibacteria group bacterium]